jgi:starch synthase
LQNSRIKQYKDMSKPKVLFISQEISPYVCESEIAKKCKSIPYGISEKGKEIRLFMPNFGCINERRNQLHEVIRLSGMNIIINDTDHPLIIKVASLPSARIQVYFIDNEEYFHKKLVLRDKNEVFYPNNDERALFFARGVIETIKNLGWAPDIIHCHGWMSHLIPLYVKRMFKDNPLFADSKVIFSFYNDEFPEPLSPTFIDNLVFDGISQADQKHFKTPTYISTMKSAADFSDALIVGSENLHPEVRTYLSQLSKPMLAYNTEENFVNLVNDFYDELMVSSNVLIK